MSQTQALDDQDSVRLAEKLFDQAFGEAHDKIALPTKNTFRKSLCANLTRMFKANTQPYELRYRNKSVTPNSLKTRSNIVAYILQLEEDKGGGGGGEGGGGEGGGGEGGEGSQAQQGGGGGKKEQEKVVLYKCCSKAKAQQEYQDKECVCFVLIAPNKELCQYAPSFEFEDKQLTESLLVGLLRYATRKEWPHGCVPDGVDRSFMWHPPLEKTYMINNMKFCDRGNVTHEWKNQNWEKCEEEKLDNFERYTGIYSENVGFVQAKVALFDMNWVTVQDASNEEAASQKLEGGGSKDGEEGGGGGGGSKDGEKGASQAQQGGQVIEVDPRTPKGMSHIMTLWYVACPKIPTQLNKLLTDSFDDDDDDGVNKLIGEYNKNPNIDTYTALKVYVQNKITRLDKDKGALELTRKLNTLNKELWSAYVLKGGTKSVQAWYFTRLLLFLGMSTNPTAQEVLADMSLQSNGILDDASTNATQTVLNTMPPFMQHVDNQVSLWNHNQATILPTSAARLEDNQVVTTTPPTWYEAKLTDLEKNVTSHLNTIALTFQFKKENSSVWGKQQDLVNSSIIAKFLNEVCLEEPNHRNKEGQQSALATYAYWNKYLSRDAASLCESLENNIDFATIIAKDISVQRILKAFLMFDKDTQLQYFSGWTTPNNICAKYSSVNALILLTPEDFPYSNSAVNPLHVFKHYTEAGVLTQEEKNDVNIGRRLVDSLGTNETCMDDYVLLHHVLRGYKMGGISDGLTTLVKSVIAKLSGLTTNSTRSDVITIIDSIPVLSNMLKIMGLRVCDGKNKVLSDFVAILNEAFEEATLTLEAPTKTTHNESLVDDRYVDDQAESKTNEPMASILATTPIEATPVHHATTTTTSVTQNTTTTPTTHAHETTTTSPITTTTTTPTTTHATNTTTPATPTPTTPATTTRTAHTNATTVSTVVQPTSIHTNTTTEQTTQPETTATTTTTPKPPQTTTPITTTTTTPTPTTHAHETTTTSPITTTTTTTTPTTPATNTTTPATPTPTTPATTANTTHTIASMVPTIVQPTLVHTNTTTKQTNQPESAETKPGNQTDNVVGNVHGKPSVLVTLNTRLNEHKSDFNFTTETTTNDAWSSWFPTHNASLAVKALNDVFLELLNQQELWGFQRTWNVELMSDVEACLSVVNTMLGNNKDLDPTTLFERLVANESGKRIVQTINVWAQNGTDFVTNMQETYKVANFFYTFVVPIEYQIPHERYSTSESIVAFFGEKIKRKQDERFTILLLQAQFAMNEHNLQYPQLNEILSTFRAKLNKNLENFQTANLQSVINDTACLRQMMNNMSEYVGTQPNNVSEYFELINTFFPQSCDAYKSPIKHVVPDEQVIIGEDRSDKDNIVPSKSQDMTSVAQFLEDLDVRQEDRQKYINILNATNLQPCQVSRQRLLELTAQTASLDKTCPVPNLQKHPKRGKCVKALLFVVQHIDIVSAWVFNSTPTITCEIPRKDYTMHFACMQVLDKELEGNTLLLWQSLLNYDAPPVLEVSHTTFIYSPLLAENAFAFGEDQPLESSKIFISNLYDWSSVGAYLQSKYTQIFDWIDRDVLLPEEPTYSNTSRYDDPELASRWITRVWSLRDALNFKDTAMLLVSAFLILALQKVQLPMNVAYMVVILLLTAYYYVDDFTSVFGCLPNEFVSLFTKLLPRQNNTSGPERSLFWFHALVSYYIVQCGLGLYHVARNERKATRTSLQFTRQTLEDELPDNLALTQLVLYHDLQDIRTLPGPQHLPYFALPEAPLPLALESPLLVLTDIPQVELDASASTQVVEKLASLPGDAQAAKMLVAPWCNVKPYLKYINPELNFPLNTRPDESGAWCEFYKGKVQDDLNETSNNGYLTDYAFLRDDWILAKYSKEEKTPYNMTLEEAVSTLVDAFPPNDGTDGLLWKAAPIDLKHSKLAKAFGFVVIPPKRKL